MSRMTFPATPPSTFTEPVFRSEGRAAGQGRTVRLTPHFVATAEGSVLIEVGNTRVLCNATVQEGVPGWMRNSGRGWVTAEYGMLPRATLTRSPREAEKGKIGGRTHEIQRLIGRSLRSVVDMRLLGERTVILDCDVLQADGGTRTAAITGACTALALALGKLKDAGTLKQSPLREMVAATSVGIVDGQVLLDLAYEEDSRAEVDMNVVMTRSARPTRARSWTRCWMWRSAGFGSCWPRKLSAWSVTAPAKVDYTLGMEIRGILSGQAPRAICALVHRAAAF